MSAFMLSDIFGSLQFLEFVMFFWGGGDITDLF